MDKEFASFVYGFIKQYKKDVFKDMSKCKSLLLDHAKGEYKNEIRLLLQALDIGCYESIINSNDLNITRMSLIKQLQEEYYISENIATSLIDMLSLELRDYKIVQKKDSDRKKAEKTNNQTKQDVLNDNVRNTSNQNQPMKNDKKNITESNLIREISSIISTKELSVKNYNEKMKIIYEPTFKEYQKIMNENNLKCRYNFYNNVILLDFSFVKSFHNFYDANYCIKNGNGVNVETRWYFVTNDYNADKKFIDETHPCMIDYLTKERIMSELKLFTEKVLKIIKKRHNL